MADEIRTVNLTEQKLESYQSEKLKNFKAESELMVTITLDEYRSLVQASTRLDLKKLEDEARDLRLESYKLKDQIKALKQTIANDTKEVSE